MASSTLILPDVHSHWPFPRTSHPAPDHLIEESALWIENTGVVTASRRAKFRNINIGLLAALAYPHHDDTQFRLACDLMNMLFAVDDASDVMTPLQAQDLADTCLRAFGPGPETQEDKEDALYRLHQDFWARLTKAAGPNVQKRFLESYRVYLQAVVVEAEDRTKDAIRLDINDYLSLRRFTGAIKPSFDLILLPLNLRPEVSEHPKIKALETLAIDMVAVANDIVSFNVEHARGDVHNAVIVVMQQRQISAQAAMDEVEKWYRDQADAFIEIMSALPACESRAEREELKSYVWGLANWVTANYEWSFGSKRFFGPEIEHVKETGRVTLLPAVNSKLSVH